MVLRRGHQPADIDHSWTPVAIMEDKVDKVVEGNNSLWVCWSIRSAAQRLSSPCLCSGTHPVSGLALLVGSHYSPPDQAENLPGLRTILDQRNSAPVTVLPIRKKRCESS